MRTVLIDTHALLWWLTDDPRLPQACSELVAGTEVRAVVSTASCWEISIKDALGKLPMPANLLQVVEDSGFEWLPIEPHEALAAGQLPMHHRDPFDRLLVAQALARSAMILSRDRVLDRYGVKRLWG